MTTLGAVWLSVNSGLGLQLSEIFSTETSQWIESEISKGNIAYLPWNISYSR